jgi:polar amino acid transport system substrate-binding protein
MIRHAIVSVFFFLLTEHSWAEAQAISIVTHEWAPYNYSENGSLKGSSVEIVRAIARKLKANIDIQIFPNMRATAMLNTNPRTMLISMMRTPERERKYKWIGPLDNSSIYFYKKKGNPVVILTLEDARKVHSICTVHGGLVPSMLKASGFTNIDSVANDGEAAYTMLMLDRCDLAISDSPMGVSYLLKKMHYPPDAIVQTPVRVVAFPLYIACSKDIPDAEIARWQMALDDLKASGALNAIQGR